MDGCCSVAIWLLKYPVCVRACVRASVRAYAMAKTLLSGCLLVAYCNLTAYIRNGLSFFFNVYLWKFVYCR